MKGILIGRYWTKSKEYVYEQETISALLMDEINPTNIDAYLKWAKKKSLVNNAEVQFIVNWLLLLHFKFISRHLSSVPHLAGTAQDLEVAAWVRDRFIEVRRCSSVFKSFTIMRSFL